MPLALHVFEPRYRQLVADLLNDQDPQAPEFGVVALRQGWEVGELGDLHEVGTSARVTDVLPMPDGRCDLSAIGERRFIIEELDATSRPYLTGTVRWLPEPDGNLGSTSSAATLRTMQRHELALRQLNVQFDGPEASTSLVGPRELSYEVARLPSLPLPDRQQLLAAPDTAARLKLARAILRRETELILQLHSIPVSAATLRAAQADG
jgi:Lon protease-like protein